MNVVVRQISNVVPGVWGVENPQLRSVWTLAHPENLDFRGVISVLPIDLQSQLYLALRCHH